MIMWGREGGRRANASGKIRHAGRRGNCCLQEGTDRQTDHSLRMAMYVSIAFILLSPRAVSDHSFKLPSLSLIQYCT